MTVTLDGATLYLRDGNEQSGVPLEATERQKTWTSNILKLIEYLSVPH